MVRVQVDEWTGPTRMERAAILAMSHLLTLVGLVVWTLVTAAHATTAPVVSVPLTIHVPAQPRQDVGSEAAPAAEAAATAPTAQAAIAARPVAIVVNTSGHGVWLRREPAGEPLNVWPDGAPMTIVGPNRPADGHDWRHVRAADGQVGWVAADYLAGSDDTSMMDAVGLMTPGGFAPATASMRPRPPNTSRAVG